METERNYEQYDVLDRQIVIHLIDEKKAKSRSELIDDN